MAEQAARLAAHVHVDHMVQPACQRGAARLTCGPAS